MEKTNKQTNKPKKFLFPVLAFSYLWPGGLVLQKNLSIGVKKT